MNIGMIPARMGSQRLKKKNLRELGGVPLITRAIRKCLEAGVFDEVWVNSEDDAFEEIAEAEGVRFHKRPSDLANNVATSEQYIYQFLKTHDCERVFQVHSIAPLLTTEQVKGFVKEMIDGEYDVLLSCTHEQIECAYRGEPVNFTFAEKTNSQDLDPIQRVTWSITGWKSAPYIEAFEAGKTATYAGEKIGFYPVDRLAGHIIKTEEDLRIAEALLQASSPS
ncbi:MAG: NTP transferase domain-containing protein [Candidatus Omnitrophica bacterium]|nr:NTP transferase domain-containing protein [Candidatus Omnitrophota bacterium]MCB9783846.1 NTP transferase domain-containing protein [Candidatus Omnitrophota bacterium]